MCFLNTRIDVTNLGRTHLTSIDIGVDPTKAPITKFTVIVNVMRSTAGGTLFAGEYFVLVKAVRFHMCIVPFQCLETIHTDVFEQSRTRCIEMILVVKT